MTAGGMDSQVARTLAQIRGEFASGAFAQVAPDLERLIGRPPIRFATFAREHAAMSNGAA